MLVRSGFLVSGRSNGGGGGGPPTLNASFGVGSYPGDGGGFLRVLWSVNNPIGGEYVDTNYNVSAGDPITDIGAGSNTSDPGVPSPQDIPHALGTGARASATVNLYSVDDVLLDTVVISDTLLPI